MKRVLIIISVIGIGIAYWLISPLLINKRVNEGIEDIIVKQKNIPEVATSSIITLKQGNFTGLAGHNAEGVVKLLKTGDVFYLRFEDDFRVTNGPDIFVYFGKNNSYDPAGKIALLKGNVGAQNYEIIEAINPLNYDEIWIWCRSFSVPFGKATLQ
ncbi:MAG: DM13 domain-containing protein [Patescibacteria group bacterium]